MNKLIFRKFSLDILNFFLIASFSITFIVWIILTAREMNDIVEKREKK